MTGLAHRGFSLNDYSQHIIHTLRPHGYACALSGIQHIDNLDEADYGSRIGYDLILNLSDMAAGERYSTVEQRAVEFLDNAPSQPFFLSVGFFETHREFPGTPADNPDYCLPPTPLPDTPETREDMACYKASARELDKKMGLVLDALDRNGLIENTLVICTTDHGIAFPGMKCNLTDHGIGVMLIMRGPGGFGGGKVCDAMVSHIDLFPTICDLLEIDPPDWLQGKSMMPLIRGETAEINEEILAEVNYHAAYEPQRAVRTKRWKYIRRYDDRSSPVLPNCDDGLSKDVWLQHGWQQKSPASEQLFDLTFDPQETHNLANDPSVIEVLKDMRARLDRWMQTTDDPLLHGPVPAPPGARINDPDNLSPREPVLTV
jgi:arylsulfatase A-like enzyme